MIGHSSAVSTQSVQFVRPLLVASQARPIHLIQCIGWRVLDRMRWLGRCFILSYVKINLFKFKPI